MLTKFTNAQLEMNSDNLTVYEAVYMETGMKAGARLLFQLLHTDDETAVETVQESQ